MDAVITLDAGSEVKATADAELIEITVQELGQVGGGAAFVLV